MTKNKYLKPINHKLDTSIFRYSDPSSDLRLPYHLCGLYWKKYYQSSLRFPSTRSLSIVCSIPYSEADFLLSRQAQYLNSFSQSWENLSIMLRLYGFTRYTMSTKSIRYCLLSFSSNPSRSSIVFFLRNNKTFVPCISGVPTILTITLIASYLIVFHGIHQKTMMINLNVIHIL